jgi:hypothetical protein
VAVDRIGQESTFDQRAASAATTRRIDGHRAFISLSCAATDQCTAVDSSGLGVTFEPGTGQRLAENPIDPDPPTGVSCPTRTFCAAVDRTGRALVGNPRSRRAWIATTLPGAGPLLSVFCTSWRQCMAVDADGHAFTASP